MPQIWVTDVELAAILRCTAPEARRQSLEAGLARRRCSDGETRVKVPPSLLAAVVARFFGPADRAPDLAAAGEGARDTVGATPVAAGYGRRLPLAA